MTLDRLPDPESLADELDHLRRRQLDLVCRHENLSRRMAVSPNDFGLAWARSLAAEIEVMGARIEELEAVLVPSRTLARPRL